MKNEELGIRQNVASAPAKFALKSDVTKNPKQAQAGTREPREPE